MSHKPEQTDFQKTRPHGTFTPDPDMIGYLFGKRGQSLRDLAKSLSGKVFIRYNDDTKLFDVWANTDQCVQDAIRKLAHRQKEGQQHNMRQAPQVTEIAQSTATVNNENIDGSHLQSAATHIKNRKVTNPDRMIIQKTYYNQQVIDVGQLTFNTDLMVEKIEVKAILVPRTNSGTGSKSGSGFSQKKYNENKKVTWAEKLQTGDNTIYSNSSQHFHNLKNIHPKIPKALTPPIKTFNLSQDNESDSLSKKETYKSEKIVLHGKPWADYSDDEMDYEAQEEVYSSGSSDIEEKTTNQTSEYSYEYETDSDSDNTEN